jgi:hypothetical protein
MTIPRLLAHVRRGVVARDRVLRHQEAGEEDVDEDAVRPAMAPEAAVVDRLAEDVADRAVVVGHDDQDPDDHEDADHVPPR